MSGAKIENMLHRLRAAGFVLEHHGALGYVVIYEHNRFESGSTFYDHISAQLNTDGEIEMDVWVDLVLDDGKEYLGRVFLWELAYPPWPEWVRRAAGALAVCGWE